MYTVHNDIRWFKFKFTFKLNFYFKLLHTIAKLRLHITRLRWTKQRYIDLLCQIRQISYTVLVCHTTAYIITRIVVLANFTDAWYFKWLRSSVENSNCIDNIFYLNKDFIELNWIELNWMDNNERVLVIAFNNINLRMRLFGTSTAPPCFTVQQYGISSVALWWVWRHYVIESCTVYWGKVGRPKLIQIM